jgi:predicted aldo/keto reductase-like oxidoreductase
MGFSYHDRADLLDRILTEHPEVEFVQLQLNYLDWESEVIESRKCYEVCKAKGVPCVTMEPVKGGTLANLPGEAEKYLKELNGGSNASYAIRFAASFDNQFMVLSGMSNLEQMKDNISFMKDFKPLSYAEEQTIERVKAIYQTQNRIPCTSCRYCVDGCYGKINIPQVFS